MMKQNSQASEIRKIRLILKQKGQYYKVCKLMFTGLDSSLYIIPYAINGKFFAGGRKIAEKQLSDSFNFRENREFEQLPKLSIHELGEVHIETPLGRLGPLMIPPLHQLRGQHVATICPDSMSVIPIHTKTIKRTGAEIDYPVSVPNRIENCRLAIFINGLEPKLEGEGFTLIIPLERQTLDKKLYIGVKVIPQSNIGPGPQSGISVICGWDPTLPVTSEQDYLYVRGE